MGKFRPSAPQNNFQRPQQFRQPMRTQQQFRAPGNFQRNPGFKPVPQRMPPIRMQQQFVPRKTSPQMIMMQQMRLAAQQEGFSKNIYPTGPQLPLNEDPRNFQRTPVQLNNFPKPNPPPFTRAEGPPMINNKVNQQRVTLSNNDKIRGQAPENQLLPKMQKPQNFNESPNSWMVMENIMTDKPDIAIPDLRPPAEQFLPNLVKAQVFKADVSPNNADIELKEENMDEYTPPPKVDKYTEKPPLSTTVPSRKEKPTSKPTKKPATTTPAPSMDEFDGEDEDEEDEEDYLDDEEANAAGTKAIANGHYYLLLPDGKLQKVIYKARNAGDEKKGPYKADLTYQDVEPIKGPIYKFDGSSLVRLN